MKPWMWGAVVGLAVGAAYTLSPLTIIFLALVLPLWQWASRSATGTERRWLLLVFALAVVTRVVAVGGLFALADPDIPYANFFGDEEFFKRRTTWLRNLGMGLPIAPADYFYTFDETGRTSYLFVLAYVQALVGIAPYGVHLMNAAFYLVSVVVLYRLARQSFGAVPALIGMVILFFLPSLFTWSVSALKEPLYFLVVATNLAAAVAVVRAPSILGRLLALAILVAGAYLLQSLREGGLLLTVAGVLGGFTLAFLAARPRLLVAAAIAVPLVAGVALTRPFVQERVWAAVHEAAYKHWGHINTPGVTYKILDDRLYPDRNLIPTMTAGEAGRYAVRAIHSYLVVPAPWQIETRASLAFLPEQMLWYCLVVLIVIGAIPAIRRDRLLGSLFVCHGAAVSLLVALSGGNVGTLVRHRGLAMPFLVWLAGVGAAAAGHWILSRAWSTAGDPMVLKQAAKAGSS